MPPEDELSLMWRKLIILDATLMEESDIYGMLESVSHPLGLAS